MIKARILCLFLCNFCVLNVSIQKYLASNRPSFSRFDFSPKIFFNIVDREFPRVDVDLDLMRGQELILMIGNTGTGKSTTIDILLGHKMEEVESDLGPPSIRVKSPRDKHLPYAKIGETSISETTIPHLYVGKKESLSYLDCPGFDDTRGQEQTAFNSLMVRLFVEKSKCVKKILCIVSKNDLQAKRGKVFVDLLIHLDNVLNGYLQYISKIFWIITKVPLEVTRERVINHITKMKNEKLKNMTSKEKKEKKLLEAILSYPQNIFVIHPLDGGKSRRLILNALKKPTSAIPKNTFQIASTAMNDIKVTLEKIFRTDPSIQCCIEYQFKSFELFTKQKEFKRLDKILKHPQKNILDIAITSKEREIHNTQEEIDIIHKEIEEIEKKGEEEIHYRTISQKVENYFFGENIIVDYDDLPFSRAILTYKNCNAKVKKELPNKGIFQVTISLNKSLVNYVVSEFFQKQENFSVKVNVVFYTKRKFVDHDNIQRKIGKIKRKETYLSKLRNELNHMKNGYLSSLACKELNKIKIKEVINIFRKQQKDIEQELARKRMILSNYEQQIIQNNNRISFIYHTHPFLHKTSKNMEYTFGLVTNIVGNV